MDRIRDKWGRDAELGVRGLEIGHRVVRNGMVKIAGDMFGSSLPRWKEWEGKTVEVSVRDRMATVYVARDPVTLDNIVYLSLIGKAF
jgi:hypothetical protein